MAHVTGAHRPETRWYAAIATLAATGLVLTGCSNPDSGDSDSDNANASANQVVLLDGQELGDFNPLLGHGDNGESRIYDSLYTVSTDEEPKPVPDLADGDAQPNADFTEWTVRLKKGIKFSDGTSFGPEDVVATYQAILDPRFAASNASTLDFVDKVTSDGNDSVTFHLNTPFSEFNKRLFTAIAPSEAFDFDNPKKAEDMDLNTKPIGTGPYKLDSFRGDELVLTARNDYWGKKPDVQRIVIRHNPDENSRAQQVRSGEGDGTNLEARLADTLAKDNKVKVTYADTLDWRGFTLPAGNPVTGDDAMRMALNLAVDRNKMLQDVFQGHGATTSTFFSKVYGDAYDKDSEFPFDPNQAEKILDEAGWKKGADGIRVKDGQRAEFDMIYFSNRDAARKDLSLATASDLKKIGIQVNPVAKTPSSVTEEMYRTTPVMLGGGDQPYTIDGQIYRTLHSKYAKEGVGAKWDNASDYVNPEIDKLLDGARAEGDASKRAEMYRKLQQEYRKKPGMVALTFGAHSYVVRDQGYTTTDTIVEPHAHGTDFGPWYSIKEWKKN